MSRQARTLSKTGTYHVMLRGINQQQIFQETEDYNKFIEIVKECKQTKDFNIYAYCLMGNHVHLLLKENEETIGQVIKRIASRFASWYNIKYQRVGHLFQDRFKSEPVETNEYFLTVLRYIHQNPVKANICEFVEEYKFSSYQEFIDEKGLIDFEFVYGCISKENFIDFHRTEATEKCLDVEEVFRKRLTDEQALLLFKNQTGCNNTTEFQALEKTKKQKRILKLYVKGMSIRQISRLTGETKGMVEKWLK
ncbi:MAG: transposase [Clostridia bacterium]|nr:transposase [Clostridia bacterium]